MHFKLILFKGQLYINVGYNSIDIVCYQYCIIKNKFYFWAFRHLHVLEYSGCYDKILQTG